MSTGHRGHIILLVRCQMESYLLLWLAGACMTTSLAAIHFPIQYRFMHGLLLLEGQYDKRNHFFLESTVTRIESVDQMLYTYTVPLIAIEMDPEVVAYTFEISSSLILPTLQTGTWDAVVILSPPSEHDWWTITLAPYNSSYYCGEPPCGTWGETTIVEDSYVSTTFTNVVPGNNYSLVLSLPTLEYSYTNIVRYPSMLIQLTARHLEDGYAEVPETTFGLTLISEVLALTVVLAGVGGLAGYLVYKHKQHRLMYNLLINPLSLIHI